MDEKKQELADKVLERLDTIGVTAQQLAETMIEEIATLGLAQAIGGGIAALVLAPVIVFMIMKMMKKHEASDAFSTSETVYAVTASFLGIFAVVAVVAGLVNLCMGIEKMCAPTTVALRGLLG